MLNLPYFFETLPVNVPEFARGTKSYFSLFNKRCKKKLDGNAPTTSMIIVDPSLAIFWQKS